MPPSLWEIEELAGRDDRPAKEAGGGVCCAVLVDVRGPAEGHGVWGREDESLGAVEDPCEVVDVVVVARDLVGLTRDGDPPVVPELREHAGGVAADHHDLADGGVGGGVGGGTVKCAEVLDVVPGLVDL